MAYRSITAPRLIDAIEKSRQTLEVYRVNRREAVREYVGKNYSEGGTTRGNLVNLLGLYTSIVTRHLMPTTPRVMLTTFNKEARPLVQAMKGWANRRMEAMYAGTILRRTTLDALFSIGIMKVGLTDPGSAAISGYNRVAGQPFMASIDLDDFVGDMHASCFQEMSWYGHRYRAPFEVVKESSLFDGKQRKELQPKPDDPYNVTGDERIRTVGVRDQISEDELFDYVELHEIYVPSLKRIYTLVEGQQEFFREQEWIGPDCGPYHFLAFGDVPGNLMPKAPIMDLFDLHRVVNEIYRKLAEQAQDQKKILAVTAGSDEDAARIAKTPNGHAVRVDNPQNMKELSFGGPDQQNFGIGINFKDTFSWLAGNLDALGGLQPQSKTLGQDQLLTEGASKTIAAMQERTMAYTSEVIKALCWFWWHDPFSTMRNTFELPNLPALAVETEVTPMQRMMVPFDDLEIKIDPYSLSHDTPQSKTQKLIGMVERIIVPGVQMAAQMPTFLTFLQEYIKLIADYENMPEIIDLAGKLIPMDGMQAEASPQGQGPKMPANTSRTYNRVSSSGPDTMADNEQMVMDMMKAEPSMNGAA